MRKLIQLSGSQLKWIAILTMLCDHTTKIIQIYLFPMENLSLAKVQSFYQFYYIVRSVLLFLGRLAFPIFCFLIVEGFLHTSNVKKYAGRLLLFALISEVPFDLAFNGKWLEFSSQNVFFTLFIGLLVLMGVKRVETFEVRKEVKAGLMLAVTLTGILAAEFLRTDYGGWIGVLMIVTLYLLRNFPLAKCLLGAIVITQNSYIGMLAFILIYFYSGKRGRQMKYFFYIFYPVHLLLLTFLQNEVIQPYLDSLMKSIR